MSATDDSIKGGGRDRLRRLVQATPLVDNHAHPLLRLEALDKHPFKSIVSEATGDALFSSWSTLSHMRAVRQLAGLYGCESTWGAVVGASESKRAADTYDTWIGRCLSGIETILVDDGLGNPEDMNSFSDLSAYTRSPCRTVVRIERLVEMAIEKLATSEFRSFDALVELFNEVLTKDVNDPRVAGFKSIVCYSSGLDVPGTVDELTAKAEFNACLETCIRDMRRTGRPAPFRLDQPALVQFFVHETAKVLRNADRPKVFQFHTGIGDNDLSLSKASPSLLQDFIRMYPTVPIVLLHAGYPFTREAAYLANTYANVWVDVGEVFPCLSRMGQRNVFHELLELAPWSKILAGTDGHYFPETYYLAQTQVREVLETVLCELVQERDMTWTEAEDLAVGVLYQNSNQLYKLNLPDRSRSREEGITALQRTCAKTCTSVPLRILEDYLAKDCSLQYLRVYWNDMTGMTRMRATHIGHVKGRLEETGEFFLGITTASLGLLQNDTLAPGVHPVGEYKVYPDWSWIRQGPRQGYLSAYAEFRESDGSPSPVCPRTSLKRVVQEAKSLQLEFLLGFELELILMDQTGICRNSQSGGHMWSSSRVVDRPIFAVIEKALAYLRTVGIHVEQVHAESAPSQFEIVLPATTSLEAIDRLIYVREVVAQYASAEGYMMTLHPKPFPSAAGNAAHVHISITGDKGDDPAVYESFYAGILTHLRAICAFTYSNHASYDRVVDGCWAGGRYVAWGTQNRETPLRKVRGSHWELKCLDGMANPYIALVAVLHAGLDGVRKETVLGWQDCEVDPATLTVGERAEFGIWEMLPGSLPEALKALADDEVLRESLGAPLVSRYVAVKEGEIGMLDAMGAEKARQWVLERY